MDVEAADIDQDGDLDIVIAHEFAPNVLLLNDGAGVFTHAIDRFSNRSHDSEDIGISDLDRDGDLDVVFAAEDDARPELYAGNGEGTFRDLSSLVAKSIANAVAVADLNNDGFPDLVLGNAGQDLILINSGSGSLNATPVQRTFANETSQRLPPEVLITQDVELADLDRDGDLDMVAGNENGNQLLINNGSGVFSNETSSRLPITANMETRKVTFGDVDRDGDLDIFFSNVAFIPGKNSQNRLYLNDGNGFFTDVTASRLPTLTGHTMDAKFIDADHDGDLDLITADIMGLVRFLRNGGDGTFTVATSEVLPPIRSGEHIGIEIADLNRDGLLDIYLVRRGEDDVLLLANPLGPAAQPVNLSTRLLVQTGDGVMIGGFIVTGGGEKHILIRGIGPSLQQSGVGNALADPEIELRAADGSLLFRNDNWRESQQSEVDATGIPPAHELESALVAKLPQGAYTAILTGRDNTTGVGLIELYDLNSASEARLANISTRGAVGTAENIMIAGLILQGNGPTARILLRGLGPSIDGIASDQLLADPTLELRDSNGELLAANNDWRAQQEQEINSTGIPPKDDREAAILARLPAGGFTALLRGDDNTAGIGLVEVYRLAD